MARMNGFRVAIDIGGTFTDIVAYDTEGDRYICHKALTTRPDLSEGIIDGLAKALENWSLVRFFVHGTTYGLNTLLQRKGARVALLTTEGFRDVYRIGRTNRPEMYNLHYRKPQPLVPRRDTYEVAERIRADGTVARPLDGSSVDRIARELEATGIESVAVALLHSYVNPEHELRVRDLLERALPGVPISLSHEVAREWREYERTSSTVLNAYIAPVMRRYLVSLRSKMAAGGLGADIHVMQSNGGLMSLDAARARPGHTLLSGPVGGAIGAVELSRRIGRHNLICVDMGGTSFDVSLVIDGKAETVTETVVEGFPLLLPVVNIFSIGAGGGSVAWLEGGGLRVGPRSAGSDPGPACYGRGGTEPTVTDSNVLLGRVNPDSFAAGQMVLDRAAAEKAMVPLARALGLSVLDLAEGIGDIINAKMAGAIRQITVARGIDPRDFTLVAFGGGGPIHAAFLAQELDIRQVLVPMYPSTFSAWGMLQCDIRADVARTIYTPAGAEGVEEDIEAIFRDLRRDGTERLLAEGVAPGMVALELSADVRYAGQEYVVNVGVNAARDSGLVSTLERDFHQAHQARYGHSNPKEQVEIVTLRVTAFGRVPRPESAGAGKNRAAVSPGTPKVAGVRPVRFAREWHDTGCYMRPALRAGHRVSGPALIEEDGTTTVVPPGYSLTVDVGGNLVLEPTGEEVDNGH